MNVLTQVAPEIAEITEETKERYQEESTTPGVSPVVFHATESPENALGYFVHWAYRGKLPDNLTENYCLVDLVELWLSGKFSAIPRLQNQAMGILYVILRDRKRFNWEEYAEFVDVLWKESQKNRHHLKFWKMAGLGFAWFGGKKRLVDKEEAISKDRMKKVLKFLDIDEDEVAGHSGVRIPPIERFL